LKVKFKKNLSDYTYVMLEFIVKRLLYGVLVIFGVVIAVFFIFHILPGDPVNMLAGKDANALTRKEIAKDLGLDLPLEQQLLMYLQDFSPISIHEDTPENNKKYDYVLHISIANKALVLKYPYLRRSYQTGKKVGEILVENLIGTIILALASMTFATVVGVLLGIIAALNQNKFIDNFIVTMSVVGISAPSFIAAILISMAFGYYLHDWTGLEMRGPLWVTDENGQILRLRNIILPAFTLGLRPLSIIVQLTRSSMLEVLTQDYIRTAKAKGLNRYQIIAKHALKNAMNPVITAVSGWLATLMGGAFFIEYIFQWKGLGAVTIKAVEQLDFPVVMGSTLVVAIFFILISIVVDILYAVTDPRVRLK
jgi:ABC-type dipeptide/oligopeptide/nickel transport system permease component